MYNLFKTILSVFTKKKDTEKIQKAVKIVEKIVTKAPVIIEEAKEVYKLVTEDKPIKPKTKINKIPKGIQPSKTVYGNAVARVPAKQDTSAVDAKDYAAAEALLYLANDTTNQKVTDNTMYDSTNNNSETIASTPSSYNSADSTSYSSSSDSTSTSSDSGSSSSAD